MRAVYPFSLAYSTICFTLFAGGSALPQHAGAHQGHAGG